MGLSQGPEVWGEPLPQALQEGRVHVGTDAELKPHHKAFAVRPTVSHMNDGLSTARSGGEERGKEEIIYKLIHLRCSKGLMPLIF